VYYYRPFRPNDIRTITISKYLDGEDVSTYSTIQTRDKQLKKTSNYLLLAGVEFESH